MPAVALAWVIGPYDLRVLPVGLQAESVKLFWHASCEADSPRDCRPGVEAFIYPEVLFFFQYNCDKFIVKMKERRLTYSAVACLSSQPFLL